MSCFYYAERVCVTGHALLSALVKRIGEGYLPREEERAALVKAGCPRQDVDSAIDGALARIAETVERDARVDMYRAAPAELDARITMVGSAAALALKAGGRFNRIVGFGMGEEDAREADVDTLLAAFEGLDAPGFYLCSHARPRGIEAWLTARGMRETSRWTKLLRDARPVDPAPTDLAIEETGDGQELAETIAASFESPRSLLPWSASLPGRPRWRAYVARDDGRSVACGVMFVDGPHAWLGLGATLPTHRRRGAHAALLARRLEDALAAGCRWIVLETMAGSRANAIRAGFVPLYERPSWTR
jgi:GNAT superfamily N-acetyltransferase